MKGGPERVVGNIFLLDLHLEAKHSRKIQRKLWLRMNLARKAYFVKPIIRINGHFAVTGALEAGDFAEIARLGFKAIISNLPDGEIPHLPQSAEAARLAAAAGLAYHHVPVTKFSLFSPAVVGAIEDAAGAMDGPVLAHCASGMRSAVAWGAAAARYQPAENVVRALAKAGFNAAPLQQEFAAQRKPEAGPVPAALQAEG